MQIAKTRKRQTRKYSCLSLKLITTRTKRDNILLLKAIENLVHDILLHLVMVLQNSFPIACCRTLQDLGEVVVFEQPVVHLYIYIFFADSFGLLILLGDSSFAIALCHISLILPLKSRIDTDSLSLWTFFLLPL